jgi:hypothetical protein
MEIEYVCKFFIKLKKFVHTKDIGELLLDTKYQSINQLEKDA